MAIVTLKRSTFYALLEGTGCEDLLYDLIDELEDEVTAEIPDELLAIFQRYAADINDAVMVMSTRQFGNA